MKNRIKEILSDRKVFAEIASKNCLEKAFLISGFKKLYTREKELLIQKAKLTASFNSNEKPNIELKKIIHELKENHNQQNELLKSINLKYQDLTPNYYCSLCEDTGFIKGIQCKCVNKIISELNLNQLCVRKLRTFEDCDFSIFKNPDIPEFYIKMKTWAKSSKKKLSAIIQGDVGSGKTFLLECLAVEFMKQDKFVIFATAFEMNNDFLKYHTTFNNEKMLFLSKYYECEILIIDDLGSEPILKNVTKEYLYLVINQRMIENKITLISTNLEPAELKERYGERIFSRLINKKQNILFKFENEDLRLRKA